MLQEVKCDHTAAKFNCILQQLLKTIIQCPYFSNLDRVTRIKLDHRAALKCDYLITFSLGLLQQAEGDYIAAIKYCCILSTAFNIYVENLDCSGPRQQPSCSTYFSAITET